MRLLKDRYGLSWQIVPEQLVALLGESDQDGVRRVTQALMGMRKLVLAELQRAAGQSR